MQSRTKTNKPARCFLLLFLLLQAPDLSCSRVGRLSFQDHRKRSALVITVCCHRHYLASIQGSGSLKARRCWLLSASAPTLVWANAIKKGVRRDFNYGQGGGWEEQIVIICQDWSSRGSSGFAGDMENSRCMNEYLSGPGQHCLGRSRLTLAS